MSTALVELDPSAGRRRARRLALEVGLFAAVLVAGETWAKWWPYGHKLAKIAGNHIYPGHSVLDAAGRAGAAPSWANAWHFTVAYGRSVWVALVAALLIGAGVQSLIPRPVFTGLFAPGGIRGAGTGALASLPCLMCTCCGAPVTNALRRSGASRSASLAYWLGNPVLNPAVLAFLALVLPWQFTVTRLAVGLVLVVGGSAVISHLLPESPRMPGDRPINDRPGSWPRRYLLALAKLAVLLVPEYFVVVIALGAFRGWLLPLDHAATTWGLAAVLVAATAGTLLVIPTGAEIPVIAGLAAAGFSAGVTGALLIALPAVSLPSMVMVGRDLTWRVVAATAAAVVVAALAGGALLSALA